MLEALSSAASQVFSPLGLMLMFLGSAIGTAVGALPGLTATMAVAVLVPVTFGMSTELAMMLLLGIYCGAMNGGTVSAVLVNVPGTPAAIMTGLDGYAMAQRGEGGKAIGIATVGSFFGGIFSNLILIIAAPFLAMIALKFAAPEYFALAVFGLAGIAASTTKSPIKGMASVFFGLFISIIGLDPMTGVDRFSFGNPEMQSGLSFVPVMIGLYGLGEVLMQIHESKYGRMVTQKIKGVIPTWKEIKSLKNIFLRSSIIGTAIGALPGEGATVAAFLAYTDARQSSKHPEKFGTGAIEGVASCETANNAVTGGSLIPTLTLGIPGSGTMAVLMGAFMMHNIIPGPMLFKQHPEIVYAIFMSLAVNNFFMLVIGLAGARIFSRLVSIPMSMLMPVIVVLCIIGSYATSNSYFSVIIMIIMGIVGYFMRIFNFPVAPMVLGVVLGPLAEVSLRRSLLMSHGSLAIFFTRPGSLIVLIFTVIYLFWPYIKKYILRRPVEVNIEM
ncbi:MAG: putative tricarboxylic transport rane protein [Clostridia bacterium]|nr:putative tricarboxylic transport rane protein [Clostridia bacterium]